MKYLGIIERYFTTDRFVAHLRANILKYALQEQNLDNANSIKQYADKLVEVLEKQQEDKSDVKIYVFSPVIKSVKDPRVWSTIEEAPQERPQMQPTVDTDEPKVIKEHEFKLGDHVVVSKGTNNERTGVIVRLPMDGVDCSRSYVVDLDDKDLGWIATVDIDGVDCQNAWVASASVMELLPTTLQTNTWYHTTDFTVEELQKLLPSGTKLQVEKPVLYNGIATTPPEETKPCVVKGIVTSNFGDTALIEGVNDNFLREWFKIVDD